jgi:hypothetical protein
MADLTLLTFVIYEAKIYHDMGRAIIGEGG